MSNIITIVLLSWLAGFTAFLGGTAAWIEGSAENARKQEIIHSVVALGGGILLAAVALALVPEGIRILSPLSLSAAFCAGGISFSFLDARISRQGGSAAQFMAMLMDFVPEAISLGAVFGQNRRLGILLALFIAAQNLPEGFNSFREIVDRGNRPGCALAALMAISLLGPIAACTGHFFLQAYQKLTAAIMTFAAGAILYLVFKDIAPQANMPRRWAPPLGAVFGFLIGMLGKQLIG